MHRDGRFGCSWVVFFAVGGWVQIELPAYSSDEIMRQRLIAASTYGIGSFLMA